VKRIWKSNWSKENVFKKLIEDEIKFETQIIEIISKIIKD